MAKVAPAPEVAGADDQQANKLERESSEDFPRSLVVKKQSGLFDFSNSEAIKEKVRANKFKKDPYNVHDRYHTSGFFQNIAKDPKFENTTLGVIVVNALWISIDTDLNHEDETIFNAVWVFLLADLMFFIYFSVEVFIRFMAFKNKRDCCRDGWFVFDSTLVTLYAFDPFALGLVAKLSSGGGLDLPTAVLRLFRLARLSRLVRMLRSLPELMIMIKGMITAASAVGYTLGLLILVTYVFSIAIRNLVPVDSDIEGEFFTSVPEAMHSLIIFGTFLDALSDFIIPIKEQSTPVFILCWVYIVLAALTVMNMLIGVLCEVISAVAAEEKEIMIVDKVNEKFSAICQELDKNGDGELTWEEFKGIMDNKDAMRALESVNVDPVSLVDMGEDFFFEDNVPVKVSFDEFMGMVLDLRGGQAAAVKDVMGLGRRFNKKLFKTKDRFKGFQSKLEEMEEMLKTLAA